MIYAAFFMTIFLVMCGLFLVPMWTKQKDQARLDGYLEDRSASKHNEVLERSEKNGPKHSALIWQSLWKRSTSALKRRQSNGKLARLEEKLQQAGSPFNMSAVDFRLIRILAVGVGVGGFVGLSFLAGVSVGRLFLAGLVGFLFGWMLPAVWLNAKVKKRAQSALKELPDFVDLLTVSLEAGLGFDSALSKVIEKQKGVLSEEFRFCLDEIRLGKTRREGLLGVKSRLKVDELGTLLSNVIRAEKLGVGMVQVLRVQAIEVRDKRKQRAEEQAMKAPIKMLFPLVLFIFPSLFLIILGPAVIQIIQAFSNH